MFNLKPSDVQVVFIVHPNYKDTFLEWIYTLGYQYFRFQWNELVTGFEKINTIVITSNDARVFKLIDKLNDPLNSGVFFWFIGCDDMLKSVNYFQHYINNRRDEWKDFNENYKKKYGKTFGEQIKTLKG